MARADTNPNHRPEPPADASRGITRRGMLGAAGLAAGAAGLSNLVLPDTSQVASAAAAIPAKGVRSPLPEPDLVLATDGSDQTAVLQNAINVAMGPGGSGCIRLAYGGRAVINGQLTFPNDGQLVPTQGALLIVGQGANSNQQTVAPSTGTVLDLRYAGGASNAKIDTRGRGQLAFEHLSLIDTTDGTTPFIHTTLTTLKLTDVYFFGKNPSPSAVQDGIILGGTTNVVNGTFSSGFQGYGTVIRDCYFNQLRRCVLGQVFANGIVIRDCTICQACNGDSTHGAIHFIAAPAGISGGVISGCLFEVSNYVYPIILEGCNGFVCDSNNFYDDNGTTVAYHRLINQSGQNLIIPGHYHSNALPEISEDVSSTNTTVLLTAGQNQSCKFGTTNLQVPSAGSEFNDLRINTQGNGARLFAGVGAPNLVQSVAGDFYFRQDTPSTANQRLYVAIGANTWTGIL